MKFFKNKRSFHYIRNLFYVINKIHIKKNHLVNGQRWHRSKLVRPWGVSTVIDDVYRMIDNGNYVWNFNFIDKISIEIHHTLSGGIVRRMMEILNREINIETHQVLNIILSNI